MIVAIDLRFFTNFLTLCVFWMLCRAQGFFDMLFLFQRPI
ncbi:hypothetical protein HMPREF1583_01497 [Gardnerella vaginalis JCP8151B]|uniref:Uncharacterized protein n=1 Tax=Gardnerella pickettii JCP8017A TaxID=1261062 RepID=T2PLL4_9BIFI|nr:hypothetical protein HMPREF1583_01497 [Gardnerella vaginalis JCP8151B]EPI50796.1 hypothetical protein HMPREF1577_01194 [Gardnerella pickettii JCP8017A]